jgi:hypothetical protein
VDFNAVQQGVSGLNMAIAQVASQTGLGIMGVQQAISNGNLNII